MRASLYRKMAIASQASVAIRAPNAGNAGPAVVYVRTRSSIFEISIDEIGHRHRSDRSCGVIRSRRRFGVPPGSP